MNSEGIDPKNLIQKSIIAQTLIQATKEPYLLSKKPFLLKPDLKNAELDPFDPLLLIWIGASLHFESDHVVLKGLFFFAELSVDPLLLFQRDVGSPVLLNALLQQFLIRLTQSNH